MNTRSNAVTRMEDGWLQIKVPLPYSLKWVNAYLLPEQDGWTLIDPGLRNEDIEQFWAEVLSELSIAWNEIKSIVITHHHPDHYGLAGWFQQRTGAPVRMSQVALDNANRLWGENETFSGELTDAFLRHGLAEELTDDMRAHMSGFKFKVSPHPVAPIILNPGETTTMGGAEWEVHGGEGHAPGHLIFYDPVGRKLLCGDQVLPDISPNIGWMPGGDPDPLHSFLNSLQELRRLDVRMVYPGHRDPYAKYRQRIDELLEHHERRLLKMAELIGDEEKTAFEVCELLFGTRLRSNTHNLRFALAETIAHLVRMEKRGMVVRLEAPAEPPHGSQSLIRFRRRMEG
ncbi:MBL fold metallo-hydrolase [Cohnella cholangitidis]|uniref:MBL fold metallo-hydrolase n=1 Tax=Cohnella cholangitidis TaxID=2598458 RepID=A0A7G5C3I2_9BACL|nr:MBL fold metallo-hydrolase [Cohnella cholangitidis]QMV43766.1 MBL fold metallo-hydrolase [Cohnella cholangitidis]